MQQRNTTISLPVFAARDVMVPNTTRPVTLVTLPMGGAMIEGRSAADAPGLYIMQ